MVRLTEYEKRYLGSLDELEGAASVEVFHLNRGVIEEAVGDAQVTFEKIATWEGVCLDPDMQRCFLRFDDLSVHWAGPNPDFHLHGRFALQHLAATMLTRGVEMEDDEYLTEEDFQLSAELRVFDNPGSNDGGEFSALKVSPGATSPEVWHYNPSFGFFRMDLDYCGYLDALLVTKGVYGWQFLFTEADLRGPLFTGVMQSLKRALKVFPRVFPDHDYRFLEKRMANIR